MSDYTTESTHIGGRYSCRVLFKGKPLVSALAKTKAEVGPALRDLLRTCDKLCGDAFTQAARGRKWKEGNAAMGVRHIWHNP